MRDLYFIEWKLYIFLIDMFISLQFYISILVKYLKLHFRKSQLNLYSRFRII